MCVGYRAQRTTEHLNLWVVAIVGRCPLLHTRMFFCICSCVSADPNQQQQQHKKKTEHLLWFYFQLILWRFNCWLSCSFLGKEKGQMLLIVFVVEWKEMDLLLHFNLIDLLECECGRDFYLDTRLSHRNQIKSENSAVAAVCYLLLLSSCSDAVSLLHFNSSLKLSMKSSDFCTIVSNFQKIVFFFFLNPTEKFFLSLVSHAQAHAQSSNWLINIIHSHSHSHLYENN